jgi:hypothetical protein
MTTDYLLLAPPERDLPIEFEPDRDAEDAFD